MRHVVPKRISLLFRRKWLSRRIATGEGAHFEDDIVLLSKFLKPSDVAWDIGANVGTYTLHLSRVAARVFAFEPVPHNAEILRDVVKRTGLQNVVVSQRAIADRVGRARMTIPTAGFYGGFYLAQLHDAGELDVELSSVDALIASGIPQPDFIKCDVEGAELRVIAGASALIARCPPIWLLEDFEGDVIDTLRNLGYTAFVRDQKHELVEVTERTRERNYWFFPAGRGSARKTWDSH